MPVWINEFHYDNGGTDAGEFIEIAGTAGTDLTGYTLVLYNGNPSQLSAYNTVNLTGVIPNLSGGFGALAFTYPSNGIQNGGIGASGEPDGIALVGPGGVIEFISYEGSFTAASGPAAGLTSVNVGVGVFEPGDASGTSISRTGPGTEGSAFTWVVDTSHSQGAINDGQSFGGVTPPSITVNDVSVTEGDSGTTEIIFTVTRTGGTDAFSVNYATANGAADAGSDYVATSGTLNFLSGEAAKTVTVTVNGDTTFEPSEAFFLNLSGATGGAVVADAQGEGTITNDDDAPPAATVVPWINEFHYDNASGDIGEFIEIAGPAGFNLSGYSLVLYNGTGGAPYNTVDLTGVITDQLNGFGVLSFSYPVNGIQNGAPDGIALVGPSGVVEFISYEGAMVAVGGPAAGFTSVDVAVSESGTASGTSIARTGHGFEGQDFGWVLSGDDTPGVVNGGQSFADPTPRVRVSDAAVTEGDGGTQILTFTVTRSGTTEAFDVSFASADGTATTAAGDYSPVSGLLSFGVGETTKTVQVTVNGDTVAEPNETLFLNLTNPTNGAVVVDGQGKGVIVSDDIPTLKIYEIQGAGHTSPVAGQHVITTGVVTAVDTTGAKGFWIQDPNGDGNDATSDAIFIFTGVDPTVTVGQAVQVQGDVTEFGGGDANNLTTTEIASPTVTVLNGGALSPLPAAVVLGAGGRAPPTTVIDDDNNTTFDPTTDGLDFYETLEGMRVTIPDATAVAASNGNSTWVLANDGAGATGLNDRGGVTIAADDFNPERIQIFYDSGVAPIGAKPAAVLGDNLGDVTGVVSYFGGNYEVLPTSIGSAGNGGPLPREITALDGDANHVTIAGYNVENLDPTDPQSKFDRLGQDIATNLGAPDIIGLVEVQDADGAGGGANLSGQATADKLIAAIVAAGGPTYLYVEVIPDGPVGGEPGGNIRQGYLYNPSRVTYVEGSAHLITDNDPANGDAYGNSRKPLAADFQFNGETITVIDVHNTSRLGSEQLFGEHQPADNAGDQRRIDQTSPIKDYVEGRVAADPTAKVVVLGDFNAFQFETTLTQLESGGALTNLTNLLSPAERYSYIFEGNAQQIDHLLASPDLANGAQFDIVHLNTGQPSSAQATDHDAVVARLYVKADPTAVADTATVLEDQSVAIDVLANDTDPNTGDTKTLVSVSATEKGATIEIVDGKVLYTADVDAFDLLGPGETTTDTFTYVMRDAAGLTSSAAVTVTVGGAPNGPTQNGGNGVDLLTGTSADELLNGGKGADTLFGLAGADRLVGGDGADLLFGGAGIDSLSGGNGGDTLDGGAGSDTLGGAAGPDRFDFSGAFGHDRVLDFAGDDRIQLDDGQFADFAAVQAAANQVGADVVITLNAANTITLQGVTLGSLNSGDFLFV